MSLPGDTSLICASLSSIPTMPAPRLDKVSEVLSLIILCFSFTVDYTIILCNYLKNHPLQNISFMEAEAIFKLFSLVSSMPTMVLST